MLSTLLLSCPKILSFVKRLSCGRPPREREVMGSIPCRNRPKSLKTGSVVAYLHPLHSGLCE